MWRWPLVLLALASVPSISSYAAETGSASPSASESEIIWKEALAAYEAKDFVLASTHWARLIDRFPGATGYLKAHLYLGICHIEMKQAAKALAPLRYYVNTAGKTQDGVTGRLELGRAYLAAGKKHEALLTAMELDRLTKINTLSDRRADALIFKSRTLVALNRDKEARLALDGASRLAADPRTDLNTRGSAASMDLDLKLRECARLPGKGKIDEGQLRDRISRRGQCLVESVSLLKATLDVGHELTATLASQEAADAWITYFDACSNPASPPGKRSATQLKAYRQELKAALVTDCIGRVNHARGLIDDWKIKLQPPITSSADYVVRTLDRLKEAAQ
jgi:hypothetical protein